MCRYTVKVEQKELLPGIVYKVRYTECRDCYKDGFRLFTWCDAIDKKNAPKYLGSVWSDGWSETDKWEDVLQRSIEILKIRVKHYNIKLSGQFSLFSPSL
jgi:hypothetical protein